MENREEEQKLLDAAGVKGRMLVMKDGGVPVGSVIVCMEDKVLHIAHLSVKGYDFTNSPDSETVFILDTLMRSAASYGEDHGADTILTDFPDFFDFFRLRGFDVDETHAFTPMSTIVHYELGGM